MLTQKQRRLLGAAREAALELGQRELGRRGRELTALIGELGACEKMRLIWEPSNGYDAKSGQCRFQIKTRKSWTTPTVNPAGRIGRFGRKETYGFDVAVYVELGDTFSVSCTWRMDVATVKALEEVEHLSRGLHVSTFRAKGTLL